MDFVGQNSMGSSLKKDPAFEEVSQFSDIPGKLSMGMTGTHSFQRLQFENNGRWTKPHAGDEL